LEFVPPLLSLLVLFFLIKAMNSDLQNQTPNPEVTADEQAPSPLDIQLDTPGPLSKLSTDNAISNVDWRDMGDKVANFLDEFPGFLNDIFSQYRRPLTTVGVVVLAFLSVAIADGILDVVNALPLVAPLLELVGLGYTGWFIWRYLLYAEKRQELGQNYQTLKDRITGHKVD
jgi:hypothetical protein